MEEVIESKRLNNLSLFLIALIFFGYFGHSSVVFINRIPAYLLFVIGIVRLILYKKHNSFSKYKFAYKYWLWYGAFIIYNYLSIQWTISKSYSEDLVRGISLTYIYISGIMLYATNNEKLKKIMKILIASYVYMCIRLIICDMSVAWTDNFGNSVGSHFNRIASELSYGILISFYFFKKEKRNIYIILISLFYFVIFLTGSRKGITMPIFFISIFLLLNTGFKVKRIIRNIIIAFLLFLIISSMLKTNERLSHRLSDLYNSIVYQEKTKDGSINERKFFRETAMKLFSSSPIKGIGTNGFRAYLVKIGYKGTIAYSHCNYTELLCTLGIIGFLLYYVMYFFILKNSLKNFSIDNLEKILVISFICIQTIFEYGSVSFYMLEFQLVISIMFLISEYYYLRTSR